MDIHLTDQLIENSFTLANKLSFPANDNLTTRSRSSNDTDPTRDWVIGSSSTRKHRPAV